jgi:D-amino-acid dehydrogenase
MKVIVIGAGVIGLASAHALADEGHRVTILDREGPAAGASRGNAGWLAHTDLEPLASPRMLRKVPQFLLDPLGPLAIRPSYLPAALPWVMRLLAASTPGRLETAIAAMSSLQLDAFAAFERMAGRLSLQHLIHRHGGLYVFETKAAASAAEQGFAHQRKLGIAVALLPGDEARRLEPALSSRVAAAAFYPDSAHVSDPALVTQSLFDAALGRAIRFERAEVSAIMPGERPALRLADGSVRESEAVVLACGAWSKPLAAGLGDRVPLDTERGYNVSFPGFRLVSRPLSIQGYGFVVTPLESGLRIGGAVELGGLALPPNHARTRALHQRAGRFINGLPAFETGTLWMGFRPSLPDSLPVIGPSRATPRIVHAFGHAHYGLTQSAVTAGLVADLVAGRRPAIDLAPFAPGRFS